MRSAFALGVVPPLLCLWLAVQADPTPDVALPNVRVDCDAGGPVTPTVDYVLANITIIDRFLRVGGINGHKVESVMLDRAADEYARAQPSPAYVLALMAQCLPDAKVRYPAGYTTIARALYREAQRRPGS